MASLRSSAAYRIAVTFAAALAWAILLIGAVVYFAANAEFSRQRDRDIAEELERLSREPSRSELLRELDWRASDGSSGRLGYALFDRAGRRVAGTLDMAQPPLGFSEMRQGDNGRSSRTRRLGAVDVATGDRLVVATDSSEIRRVDAMILKLFLSAFLGVLAICAIGGWVLARYLRFRLKAISGTANAIVTGDIEWRVPVSRNGDEFDAAGRSVNLMLDRIAGLMENLRQVSSDIAHDLHRLFPARLRADARYPQNLVDRSRPRTRLVAVQRTLVDPIIGRRIQPLANSIPNQRDPLPTQTLAGAGGTDLGDGPRMHNQIAPLEREDAHLSDLEVDPRERHVRQ